jgi:DNA-binding NtrC family response regulator
VPRREGKEFRAPVSGRLLVVDDEATVRGFLAVALFEMGHDVVVTQDGTRAIDFLRAGGFDLVLTNVRMPGLCDLDVLREAKRRDPATEVVVITAHATLEIGFSALSQGAYGLMTKPLVNSDDLHRVVGHALGRRRHNQEHQRLDFLRNWRR